MWRAIGRQVATGSKVSLEGATYIFTAVPGEEKMVDLCRAVAARPDTCVAVDVCFPLLWIETAAGNDEALAYWREPERREHALRAIQLADVVTTPRSGWFAYPEWVDALAEHNPNVVVLPDLVEPDDDEALNSFAEGLQRAWRSGLKAKRARLAARQHG